MQLDHVTIVTPDCEAARRFFVDVADLTPGPRPPFGFEGHWLYLGDAPVVHLIASPSRTSLRASERPASSIDHLALRVQTESEWRALLDRLRTNDTPFRLTEVPLTHELQLFVQPVPGILVEFVRSMIRPLKST
jgi:catechol 2,3-dioxygenase-like lactoylglutathione lyase family enzyme